MKTQLTLLSNLLSYPYAVFMEDTCIFESKLDDTYILKSLMKNIGCKITPNKIIVKSFRGFIFFAIKPLDLQVDYTLFCVIKKSQTTQWSDEKWEHFYKLFQTAAYLITVNDIFPIDNIDKDTELIKQEPNSAHKQNFTELNTDFQDNYQLELNLISLLKKKDFRTITPLLQKLISINTSQLSDDLITDRKYKLISFLTVLTRASVKQGCSANLSYRLSDSLILKLDKLTTIEEIRLFTEHLLIEFSNLLINTPNNYASELVNSAISYIHANLYEELSNHDIASSLSVHPSYLSSLFKKTTGISLHHYIIKEKIAEAQYLLSNTDFPFAIISELLHFSNQSHFCKLFKTHTSYTPKEFRLWF